MPAPKGARAVAFAIGDKDAVHVYSDCERVWLQLRRNIPTQQDINAPSFKVAVTLTQKQAIAIAGELLTAATCRHPSTVPSPTIKDEQPAVPTTDLANRGRLWTEAEEKRLLDAFDAGTPIPELSKNHRRGAGSIQGRLIKLGKITRADYRCFPSDRPESSAAAEGSAD